MDVFPYVYDMGLSHSHSLQLNKYLLLRYQDIQYTLMSFLNHLIFSNIYLYNKDYARFHLQYHLHNYYGFDDLRHYYRCRLRCFHRHQNIVCLSL